MSSAASWRSWSSSRRSASRPAWTPGCSVFTRPSSDSGNPVTAATSVTAWPASRIVAAVEPVETISTPAAASASASLSRSVLSLTETSARRIGTRLRSRYRDGSWLGPAMGAPRVGSGVSQGVGGSPHGGEVEFSGGDPADDVDQKPALDRLDAIVQRVLVIAGKDGDALLREDRAAVDAVVDDDDARPRLRDSGGEGVAHAVRTGELGQVGRVGVDDPGRPRVHQ